MNTRLLLAACALATSAACTGPDFDAEARGAELLMPFKTNLKSALVEGMQTGPVEAITVCSMQAPSIVAALSVDGVVMGRSSHKLRNPDNAPPRWLAGHLDSFAAGNRQGPLVLRLDGGRYGYAEPIATQAMCLLCHGEKLAPDIATRISEAYPQDKATGFREGDIRGVFWVEFPAP
jgi:hypothetical protein